MKTSAGWAMLSPHRVIMAMIFGGALMVGVAILPGANERVAMLERDGHSRDALKILETEYAHGDRKYRTLYQMQALYENEGNLPKARQLLEAMAVANPRDAALRGQLTLFYKNAQDQPAYIGALKTQIDTKYSESACRELIALLRSQGVYAAEQSALQQCRQRGYRRPEDLSRLAELVAADGDGAQAATILRSIDDLKRLRTGRERYQLLVLLLEQDQPNEAERRALRWIKGSKDDGLAIGLIDTLAHSKFPNLAIAVAKEAGSPGDSVSLTIAERLIERSEFVPAKLYLNGWLTGWQEKSQVPQEGLPGRFVEAALNAGDPATALKGARKFGLATISPALLERLATDLTNASLTHDAADVRKVLGIEEEPKLSVPDDASGTGDGTTGETPSATVDAVQSAPNQSNAARADQLEPWRRSLWAKMSDDALRRGQALGLAPMQPVTIEPIASRGRGGNGQRAEPRQSVSSKLLKKTNRVLQRTKRIRSLRHRPRSGARPGVTGQTSAPYQPNKDNPYP